MTKLVPGVSAGSLMYPHLADEKSRKTIELFSYAEGRSRTNPMATKPSARVKPDQVKQPKRR
jgi:hypothetical protein